MTIVPPINSSATTHLSCRSSPPSVIKYPAREVAILLFILDPQWAASDRVSNRPALQVYKRHASQILAWATQARTSVAVLPRVLRLHGSNPVFVFTSYSALIHASLVVVVLLVDFGHRDVAPSPGPQKTEVPALDCRRPLA